MTRKIYIASSWRNEFQQDMVKLLRSNGHDVYDFKNPAPGNTGFSWKQAGPVGTVIDYMKTVYEPVATKGFEFDRNALDWCNTCVLLLPCGRSAHLEGGYVAGQGKLLITYLSPIQFEPELMYRLGRIVNNPTDLLMMLG